MRSPAHESSNWKNKNLKLPPDIFANFFDNVVRRSLEPVYRIFMYLYNKNILKYAQIVVTHANSKILNIEGHSIIFNDKL